MASKFYFFTDTNLLLSQPASDAFGPAGTDGAGNDQYRISSMHSASADPGAYAICSGIVCAQDIPGTSPALVNLILKPLDRPPINFVPIRYYIYKGILKDKLFNGAAIAASGTNQLTTAIWDSQNARNQSANTPNVPPPAEALGINLTEALDSAKYGNDKSIDNLFYRTGGDAQFPPVTSGWKIGTFDKTRFGFEILLDGLGYSHELANARSLENYIRVETLTGSSSADVFAHWHKKEKVLGFMDPCAFFGSFCRTGVKAKTSAGAFELKQGAPLNKLYKDVVSLFYNKNRSYVDIRNEHNNSLNYFDNYGRHIQVAFDGSANLSSLDYYATGWPILIVEGTATQFPASNATHFNTLRVTLPAGDNPRPLLYLSQGYKSKGATPFSRELSSADSVMTTNEVALALPNLASSTNAEPIACYVKLKYFKRINPGQTVTPGSPATVATSNYLDNIFYPLELQTNLSGSAPVKSTIYDEDIYVDARGGPGIDFVGKLGFAIDSYNVTFFAFPKFIVSGDQCGKTVPFSIVGEAFNENDTYLNLLVRRFSPKVIVKNEIALSSNPINNVNVVSVTEEATTDRRSATPSFTHFIGLVFDNAVYQGLLSLATSSFLAGYRVYLGLKNIVFQEDTTGREYTSYEIVLRGYVLNNDHIEVKEQKTNSASAFTSNIKVYSR